MSAGLTERALPSKGATDGTEVEGRVDGASSARVVWREVRGAEAVRKAESERRAWKDGLERGLVRCPVCGGAASIRTFGLFGEGVAVGCRGETAECARNAEVHLGGWSAERVSRDWNRRNGGILGLLRGVKRRIRSMRCFRRREEREWEASEERRKREGERRMREALGIVRERRGWREAARRCLRSLAWRNRFRGDGGESVVDEQNGRTGRERAE